MQGRSRRSASLNSLNLVPVPQPSSSSPPSLCSLPVGRLMIMITDARTARNAPATRGLARLELQSNTKRLGRARVVGANAPGSCGSTWRHTGTVVACLQKLEEGCSPGRSKMVISQGQGGVGLPAHLGGGFSGDAQLEFRSCSAGLRFDGPSSLAEATALPAGPTVVA